MRLDSTNPLVYIAAHGDYEWSIVGVAATEAKACELAEADWEESRYRRGRMEWRSDEHFGKVVLSLYCYDGLQDHIGGNPTDYWVEAWPVQ